MINTLTTEEDEMKPQLRLLRGGKGPPINTGGVNWLRGLNKNAAFSCKRKGNVDNLELYIVAFKHLKTVILVNGLDNNHRFAVDPEDFCKKYNLFEIIEEGGEHPEEVTDGNSEGTIRSPDVEDDVDVTGRQ
jgi:hypothetical protein